jgi:hypothetical protein
VNEKKEDKKKKEKKDPYASLLWKACQNHDYYIIRIYIM